MSTRLFLAVTSGFGHVLDIYFKANKIHLKLDVSFFWVSIRGSSGKFVDNMDNYV